MVLLVVANAVRAPGARRTQPRQTTNVMLVVVGAGAVLLSLRWLLATLYLAWGAWAVGAFMVGPADAWPHYVVGMVSATAALGRRQPSAAGGRPRPGRALAQRPRRPRCATT